MRIIITGTPGTGKTSIAKMLGEALGIKVLNEKEFALNEGIGEFDSRENELVVPLEKLEARLNKFFARRESVIIEGHMLCEIKAKADFVILLRIDPERLASRLELRGYKEDKIQDNVFCEGIDYCKKHCARNYPKSRVIEVWNNKSIKEGFHDIILKLRRATARKTVKVKLAESKPRKSSSRKKSKRN